jgi:hypothetical protein
LTDRDGIERFFGDAPVGLAVHDRVVAVLDGLGPYETRVSRSQVAFRRRRGFAYLWLPRTYLRGGAEVVLSVALDREVPSPRWKEVAHPAAVTWMHHLEINTVEEIDDEVAAWLAEAYRAAE